MSVQRYVPMHALEGKRAETMNYAAIGAIIMFIAAAVVALCCVAYQAGKRDGREAFLNERAELRSQRRAEARLLERAGKGTWTAPFPGDDDEAFEKLATTGELRAIAYEGDTGRLKDEIAAFFRVQDLREWTRKRAGAA